MDGAKGLQLPATIAWRTVEGLAVFAVRGATGYADKRLTMQPSDRRADEVERASPDVTPGRPLESLQTHGSPER
jgi:hypothetical protein